MKAKLVYSIGQLLFVALNLADLFLTWRLVHGSHGAIVESNPVANWWLTALGWPGLSAYKLGIVVLVGTVIGVIRLKRPRAGSRVLAFACSAVLVVVLYSCWLSWSLGLPLTGTQVPPISAILPLR
jgi:hypothetical protein